MAFLGFIGAYLTHEPEGVPVMFAAGLLVGIAVMSHFSKRISLVFDYAIVVVMILAFVIAVYVYMYLL